MTRLTDEVVPRATRGPDQAWADAIVKWLTNFIQKPLGGAIFRGLFTTGAGRVKALRRITTGAAGDVLTSDHVVVVAIATAYVLTLPTQPQTGQEWEIRAGIASPSITIAAPAGLQLNGVLAGTMTVSTSWARAAIIYDGTQFIAS